MKQDGMDKNNREHKYRPYILGRPVYALAVIDVIRSGEYAGRSPFADFCKCFVKRGCKGTDFQKITQRLGDSFYMLLKSKEEISLQRSLEVIHYFPRLYAAGQRKVSEDFYKYLQRDRFFHCGVAVGSIGQERNNPQTNNGYVYSACYDAMEKHKEVIPINGKKGKAVFKSLFDDSLDVIMNWAELAITLMSFQYMWKEHRDLMIQLWDRVVLLLRKELKNRDQWITVRSNCKKFIRSKLLEETVAELYERCVLYYQNNQHVECRDEILIKLSEGYSIFQKKEIKVLLFPEDDFQNSMFQKCLARAFWRKNIKKTKQQLI